MRLGWLLLALALPLAAAGDDGRREGHRGDREGHARGEHERREHDHDQAREAVRSGEAQPLSVILPAVEAALSARVIEVELERLREGFVYEFDLITPDGRILEALVDARDGRLLSTEDKER